MKTHNSIKRFFVIAVALFAMLATASAQWTEYDCSVTPEDYGFSEGSSGLGGEVNIITDEENVGNSLLELIGPAELKNYWKIYLTDSAAMSNVGATFVTRFKALDDTINATSFQIYTGAYYTKIYMTQDGKLKVDKDQTYSTGLDFTEYHVFRMTMKGADIQVWVDDVKYCTFTTTAESTNKQSLRFGDASNDDAYSAVFDWIIWDETGVYAPGEGSDYPADYIISPLEREEVGDGDWTIYSADETFADFGFSPGSSSDFGGDVTVIADEDNTGNNLVELIGPDTLKNYWKYYLVDSAAIATQGVTIVTRLKAQNDTSDIAAIQITTGEFYAKIYIKNDGELKVDGDATYDTGLDFTENHVFRVTMVGSTLNVWVDDIKQCNNYTVTSTSSNSPSYRIGDASTSDAYSAVIDWIIWDETGAYEPGEGSDYPSSLIIEPLQGGEVIVPDFLRFDEKSVEVAQAGETITAGLEANVAWTLECDDAWITNITPLAGDSGVASFDITAQENTGAAPRSATIYGMVGEEEMDMLTITQDGLAVQIDALSAVASSEELKDGITKYASFAIDGYDSTAWVYGDGIVNGASEWIKVALPTASEVVLVKIMEYKNNERLTGFSVDYWNGTEYVESLPQQLSPLQAVANSEVAYSLPSAVTTDTIMFKFYGNAGTTETDPSVAAGWLTISEVSCWGGAPTRIADVNQISYAVYPNPSTGSITIENASGANIRLISLTGQVMLEKSNISANEKVDLNLNTGIYLLSVDDSVSKIVIK